MPEGMRVQMKTRLRLDEMRDLGTECDFRLFLAVQRDKKRSVIGLTLEQKWPIHPHIKIIEFDHMLAERVIQIALILHLIGRNNDMASFSTDP